MTQYIPFAITAAYLVAAVIIGVRAGRGHNMSTVRAWGVGDRSLNPFVTYLLIGAGAVSAYTFMGSPGWAFSRGVPVMYVVVYVSFMAFLAWYLGPKVWHFGRKYGHVTQASTITDRYESPVLGGIAAAGVSIAGLAYAVLQTIGSAYILNVMSFGLIPTWMGVILVLGVISIYLYRSGLRAIGMTNALQGVLMFVTAWLVGLWAINHYTGGFSARPIFERLQEDMPQFLTLPGALGDMNYAFWTTSILISFFSIWQAHWISWMGAASPTGLRKATTFIPLYYIMLIPMIVVGFIGIFEYPEIGNPDQVAIQMAVDNMPVLLAGLLGAGTLAASMSSSEPQIHATALTYSKDIIQPLFKLSEERTGKLTRWLIFPIMALIIAPISIAEPASLVYILLIGYGFSGQAMPTMLGIFFWPRATKWGALTGMAAGLLVTVLFSFFIVHPLGIHAGIWGLMVNIPLFVIVSLLTRPSSDRALARYFERKQVAAEA
ncbi:sodium:solute symporter family protein [Brevibacterium album]|uniref:sodium:solute symporter family protein n=1 Tax=Brevibacterium album TaxID=417948 RepID=UPI00041E1493|nr:sodium:solute symporter family protein [Brevibacterium album]